jgi:hypothetical protein
MLLTNAAWSQMHLPSALSQQPNEPCPARVTSKVAKACPELPNPVLTCALPPPPAPPAPPCPAAEGAALLCAGANRQPVEGASPGHQVPAAGSQPARLRAGAVAAAAAAGGGTPPLFAGMDGCWAGLSCSVGGCMLRPLAQRWRCLRGTAVERRFAPLRKGDWQSVPCDRTLLRSSSPPTPDTLPSSALVHQPNMPRSAFLAAARPSRGVQAGGL